ncbi:hypothetical protein RHS01_09628 [Rhizoctonia solani]|uniref:Uncharacterized protein n=1 Tax=Rhizoctonia solani TaxID=456999 RepID=A0A8H7I6J5_9AGAM|nr:hypothetical protein RHS01_09628 [Rhizoctonia solani]
MAELDWNTEAYIAQFTRGLHWKVKELLSTKDNIPNNDLEAIFAALVKIDNTCWENKENRPKKTPAKAPVTATTSTSTTTTRVRLLEDPNYVTQRKETAVKPWDFVSSVDRRATESNSAPMAGRPQSRRLPRLDRRNWKKSKAKSCCQALGL